MLGDAKSGVEVRSSERPDALTGSQHDQRESSERQRRAGRRACPPSSSRCAGTSYASICTADSLTVKGEDVKPDLSQLHGSESTETLDFSISLLSLPTEIATLALQSLLRPSNATYDYETFLKSVIDRRAAPQLADLLRGLAKYQVDSALFAAEAAKPRPPPKPRLVAEPGKILQPFEPLIDYMAEHAERGRSLPRTEVMAGIDDPMTRMDVYAQAGYTDESAYLDEAVSIGLIEAEGDDEEMTLRLRYHYGGELSPPTSASITLPSASMLPPAPPVPSESRNRSDASATQAVDSQHVEELSRGFQELVAVLSRPPPSKCVTWSEARLWSALPTEERTALLRRTRTTTKGECLRLAEQRGLLIAIGRSGWTLDPNIRRNCTDASIGRAQVSVHIL